MADGEEELRTHAGLREARDEDAGEDRLAGLPAGYGFRFEVRLTDRIEDGSKPILDRVTVRLKSGR